MWVGSGSRPRACLLELLWFWSQQGTIEVIVEEEEVLEVTVATRVLHEQVAKYLGEK